MRENNPARSKRQGKTKGDQPVIPRNILRAFAKHDRAVGPETDTRVMTYNGVINTTTGNTIGGSYGSGLVTSATEFASLAARYQEFRVLALKLLWVPRFGQANESCAVAESGMPIGAAFVGGVAPSSVAAILACDGAKIAKTVCKQLVIEADYKLNQNALLWSPASSSPAAANQFGIVVRHPGVCPANLNNVNCVDYYIEFVVEWRVGS